MENPKFAVALVTGASAGIGRATAQALSQAGYRVFGTSRRVAPAPSNGITMLSCDVRDDASVTGMVGEVLKQAGRIDLLVNNAGFGVQGAAEASSLAQVRALFETNFFGVVRVTNAVLPFMREQGVGRILNMGSALGFIPAPFNAFYSATKHAIEGYSESLDHEMRGFGIRVSVIAPAFTHTSFESSAVQADIPIAAYDKSHAKYVLAYERASAAGDSAESVAETILRAAADKAPQSRYTSGKAARQVAFARRFLPRSLFDKVLRKQFGLA